MTNAQAVRKQFGIYVVTLILLSSAATACKPGGVQGSGAANPAPDPKRGEEIVAEFRKRDYAAYRKGKLRLTLTSQGEAAKVFELEIWRKQSPEETLTFTHVVRPESERDLGSLSIQRPGQPTLNIAYAQSTDRFYESDSSKQTFGGLTAQELLGEWDNYDFSFIAQKEAVGVNTYEVSGRLMPNFSSPIDRLTVLFRGDNYLPAELHLFNGRGVEIRTWSVQEYRTIEGRPSVWRTEIVNKIRNSKVVIEALELSFPDKIEDAIFTRENLKRRVSR